MTETIKVWDPLVRIFHWSLVAGFAVAYVSAEEWDRLHETAGYIAGGLIAFRLVWGFVGSRRARFSNFVPGLGTVLQYFRLTLQSRAPRYIGHNPLGGAMIVVLLLGIAAISVTGWMMTTDAYWGVKWVKELHEVVANGTLGLVILHVCGVILSSLAHGENLARAMVTGRKRAPEVGDID